MLILVCSLAVSSCVAPPPLTHATNNFPFARSIPIHDIVQRVKCDLTNALYAKIYESKGLKFAWMRNWTAKADLTLEVNESGGVTPSLSYAQPLANGFVFGLGPNSINTTTGAATNVVNATPQNFTLGATATFNGSVSRTETLSFNISMAELKDWKDSRQKLIDKGQTLTGIYSCDPSAPTDLQAGLDLNSWLDEALKPVELGDLQTGIHPTPSQSSPAAAGSPAPPAAAGPGGTKALDQSPFPDPTISPEQKAFLDLSLTAALTELEVPYDLDNGAYVDPKNPAKACTTSSRAPGKSVTFRPPPYPSANSNSLVQQTATNAQNAQSSAAEVFASQTLDHHIKQKAMVAAGWARAESLQVQKAAQYAAQHVLAVCEADTRYVNPNKCISYTSTSTTADSKLSTPNTDLVSSANPVPVGVSVTFTATVSALGSNAVPTGSVAFKDGDMDIGSGTMSGGVAQLLVKQFSMAGDHSITASYSGDANFTPSTGKLTQAVVGTGASTTTLATTPNPSSIGDQVTFTASVTGSGGTPTGTVTFKADGVVLKQAPLEGGRARYPTTWLAVGDRSVVAEYSGDPTFNSSTSDTISQKVQGGGTSPHIALWSSVNPSAATQLVTFTAKVTGARGDPIPTGSVMFIQTTKSGAIALLGNPVSLKNGEATSWTSSLPADAAGHPIVAIYSGDKKFASVSATLRQYVVKSLSGVKYVVVQLSPYFCNGKDYQTELNTLSRNQLTTAERNADLAKQNATLAGKYLSPDPPFESIGQSVNFVVTLGASTSPNWSFVRWKGPSNGGTLASIMGIRTHSLNIAMGPVTGTTEVSRVLDNAATRQAIEGLQQ